ncbi:hypothetical protein [Fusobacterium hominis]|uniref:Porin n=1 Tax=Fusobacterium hominis TaxID=2764326 RepID=A0A7G9GXE7_9FUSO|nr:hypothetical protein [Fusobacterium hominis]QNM15479.1 hypothetical protein H9Q81_01170 [Fusobacterium hominis]
MRKLGLLLATMGILSVGAYAAPKLEVTSIGQELEYEHENDANKSDIKLFTTVNLKYDDWTFAIQGGKFWLDGNGREDAKGNKSKKGLSSNNGRLQLDVWKSINSNIKLGYRYRGEKDMDRHYARYAYQKDLFRSSADVWFESKNGHGNNQIRMELFPVGVQYKGFGAKWFFAYNRTIDPAKDGQKSSYENQIRLYAPLYSNDRFSLSTEGRFTIHADKDMKNGAGYNYYKNFGRTRIYLRGNYKVTENFGLFGYYGYEFRSFKTKDGGSKPKAGDKNYQDIGLGWTYTF